MSASIPTSTLEKFATFGDLLRFLRRRAGLTQMELATAVGYSDAQISRLEQNLRLPDIPTIEARFVPVLGLDQDPKAVARLLDLAAHVRREDAPGLGLCPYKGLNYFEEVDADLFVGREELSTKLTGRVLSLSSGGSGCEIRFLAVVGASGSGKSSLVRAGLVPALRWNKISADWNIEILTPGVHPLESLAMALNGENGSVADIAAFMDDLARDRRSLHLFARRAINPMDGSRLLLVVDQFEETFVLCRSEEERTSFINNLLSAVSETNGPVMVVITLRADFYAHCARYIQLREALAQQQEYIGAMTDVELRRAIEEPARRGRWEIEPGLVDLLLRDVSHEPGALPLLSHALLETWQRRRGRLLTLSGYASSGGVRGAIAETAETVFSDQFTQEQRVIARRIFLRLTELGDQTATGDTRRRANLSELIVKPEEAANTLNVLKTLADARLIITSETSVEVAHEALIREWPTLRGWLEDNREGLRLHRHLTNAAQDWASRNREPDLLYRGARLAQAREWSAGHQEEMNPLESEFIKASQALAEQEAIEREAQRQRELEAAQRLAVTEGRRAKEQAYAARQLRKRSLYFAGAFVAALIFAFVAGFLGWQARLASRLAASRELAAASISNLDVDPERSILLALEAVTTSYTLEAEDALHQAVARSRVQLTIQAFEPGTSVSIVFSPDGKHLAAGSQDGTVKVLDAVAGKVLLTLPGHTASFSPDGKRLATVLPDGTVKLWEAETGLEVPLQGQINAGENVTFSPDGKRLATIAGESLPRIWDLKTGKELVRFPGHTDYVSYVFFSPDGRHLLTTSDDGTARIWDAASGSELVKLSDHPDWVWTAAFSPDGGRVATVSGNVALVWDTTTGQRLLTLNGNMNTLFAVAFSPECPSLSGMAIMPCNQLIATGGQERKVRIWDANTGTELFTLAGHTGAITSLAFAPDGLRLATASDDGTLKVWSLAPGSELFTLNAGSTSQVAFSPTCAVSNDADAGECETVLAGAGTSKAMLWDASNGTELRVLSEKDNQVKALAFSPNARLLVTAGDDLHMEIWDPMNSSELYHWSAHSGLVNALAFHPEGTYLVSASDDYKVKIWKMSADNLSASVTVSLASTLVQTAEADSLAFSPDGTKLATGLENGTTRIWNFSTGKELLILRGHQGAVVSLAFSPACANSLGIEVERCEYRLATASLDGTTKVWDGGTGQALFILSGHNNAVMAVAYSPDGKRIATASLDGTAKLWDAETGQELLTFNGDGSGLNSIAFSPDGKRLVTGGDSGIRIYLLDLDELVVLAKTRVTRSMTVDECQKYLHRITGSCASPLSFPTEIVFPLTSNGRVCQIASSDGIYDNYFNSLTYKGLQEAAAFYGWEASALPAKSNSAFQNNMQAFMNADCKLIVAPAAYFDATQNVAEANLDQKFMLMDFVYDPPLENIWNQVYATDQAAFLAGYAAASVTKTGKVGVFGGIDIPQVTDFMDGFALGVQYYNEMNQSSVEVLGWDAEKQEGLFAGGFCCSTEGRQMARQLLEDGADVILPVAGKSVGWGALAETEEYGNAWFIGVDTDWAVTDPMFAGIILTSIEKRFDVSVVQVAGSIVTDQFSGGIHVGTLETGEVRLSPFHQLDALISAKIKADLEQIKADIVAGKIKTKP